MMLELKKLNDRIEVLSKDLNSRHTVPVVNNISNNNNFNINVFLNETCKNAINIDSYKYLVYELADTKLIIGSYVEWTCSILQKNLNDLPSRKRPMHCIVEEDPHRKLMHSTQHTAHTTHHTPHTTHHTPHTTHHTAHTTHHTAHSTQL